MLQNQIKMSMKKNDYVLLAKALYELERRRLVNPLKYFKPLENDKINQKAFHESKKKNLIVLGGNRSGKTLNGVVKTLNILLERDNAQGWAATFSDLLIPVLERKYFEQLPKDRVIYGEYNEQRGFKNQLIIFDNESVLRFKTYEQGWETFQGASKDVIHLDEEAPDEMIVKECKMRLIDRRGTLIRTMTPINGFTYTYNEIIESKDPELEVFNWDSRFNIYIPKDELERIIESFPDKEREVRLTGKFVNLTSGQVYYNFSMNENVIDFYNYEKRLPLEVGCDFNIELMSWVVSQNVNGKDIVFDLIELENFANTQLMCDMLKEKYGTENIIFYLDFSSNQRHPEASYSNYDIIKMNFPKAIIRVNKIKNIKDRVDAVNLRLKDSKGNRNLLITKNCKRLIKDLHLVTWEMLLNKNKAGLLTHCSDGLSYMIFDKYSTNYKISVTKTNY
jgi:phage terminase large subunit-like protein